jgi:hypothetical protein
MPVFRQERGATRVGDRGKIAAPAAVAATAVLVTVGPQFLEGLYLSLVPRV